MSGDLSIGDVLSKKILAIKYIYSIFIVNEAVEK